MYLHRRPWLGAVAVGLLLVAGSAPAAELEKFIPDDSEIVVSVNVRQLLDSKIAKKFDVAKEFENKVKEKKEAGDVLKALGLDPLKDINRITIAVPGKPDPKHWFIAINGSFDLAKVHDTADKFIKTHGDHIAVSKLENVRVYEVKDPEKNETSWACFLSKDVMVVSPTKAYVVDALAKHAGKREPKFSKPLKALVAKQDSKQSIWVAAVASTEMKDLLANNEQTKDLADKLESISMGLSLTEDIKLNLLFSTTEEKTAKNLRAKLEAAHGVGKFLVNGNEQLKDYAPLLNDVLNAFKFGQDGGLVTVELTIPASLIDKAAGMVKEQK
jgi:hypothetical protein